MVECWLPYGKTDVYVSVPLRNLLGTVEPVKGQPSLDPRRTIIESLDEPIESKRLEDLAKPGARIAVAIDGTMAHPLAASAVSAIVETLSRTDLPTSNISIIIGNGLRERGNPDLLNAVRSYGGVQGLSVIEHSRVAENLASLGKTSMGTEVEICNMFVEADIRIAVSEVMVDHFTGLRGAQNSVLPALSGQKTITQSRSVSLSREIAPGGVVGNPAHSDSMDAAFLAEVNLAVNLVTNGWGELVKACSGNLEKSWEKAVVELGDSYRVKAEENADVIIVSAGGDRFDFDLYNSVWALESVSSITKKGATIILLAECSEGLGAGGLETLSQVDALSELRRRYMLGARAVYLIKTTLRRNEVILVSALPSYLAKPLGFDMERTANDALKKVYESRRGRRTLVITHGCTTIPYVG
jgi:nickel-dependent lactate racemase